MSFAFFVALSFVIVTTGLYFMWLFRKRRKLTASAAVEIVEEFLRSEGGEYDWDDFLTLPIGDPIVDNFRIECLKIDWTKESGLNEVRHKLLEFKNRITANSDV